MATVNNIAQKPTTYCSSLRSSPRSLPMVLGEGENTISRLVVFENTIYERDAAEENSDEDLSYGERAETEEEWEERCKEKFLQLYCSDSECALYDTSPIVVSRLISTIRWPFAISDVSDSLIGLRFDMEDGNKVVRGQVTGEGEEDKVRVHFDRYAKKWDREYGFKNFNHPKIRPLYMTRSPSPASPLQRIKVYHRRDRGSGDEEVDENSGLDMPLHFCFGLTTVVHCHSEWTTARAGAHILAQVARFVSSSDVSVYIGEIIRWAVEKDAEWYRMQLAEDLSAFDVRGWNAKFKKKLDAKLKKHPFTLKVASAANPGGVYGDEDTEETLIMSLVNCLGNVFTPRLCVVVHWKATDEGTCYSLPRIHVHKKSEREVRKMEVERGERGDEGGGLKLESCLKEYFKEQTLGGEGG